MYNLHLKEIIFYFSATCTKSQRVPFLRVSFSFLFPFLAQYTREVMVFVFFFFFTRCPYFPKINTREFYSITRIQYVSPCTRAELLSRFRRRCRRRRSRPVSLTTPEPYEAGNERVVITFCKMTTTRKISACECFFILFLFFFFLLTLS